MYQGFETEGKKLTFKYALNGEDKTLVWSEFKFFVKADQVVAYFFEEVFRELKGEKLQTNNGDPFINFGFKEAKAVRNKVFTEMTAYTPSAFRRIFNAKMLDLWKIEPWFSLFAFNKYKIPCSNKVSKIHLALNLLEQAKEDNLMHLTPLIVKFNLGPAELKKEF